MKHVSLDLINGLYERACAGKYSSDPVMQEFFSNPHFAGIMDNFSFEHAAYHPVYPFLFALAREMEPSFILELGTELGRGMCSMHLGWPHSPIVSVDFLEVTGPSTFVEPAAVPGMWSLLCAESVEFAMQNPDQKIDLLLIDSAHTYDVTLNEWKLYRPMMRAGGAICFDDLDCEGVRDVWNQEVDSAVDIKMELPSLHPGMSFGVVLIGEL